MSNIPDRIKSMGGYKTSRDDRNKNCRLNCPWCPKEGLLFTSYGTHILRTHMLEVFCAETKVGQTNRKALKLKAALKDPVCLEDAHDVEGWWCLGCQSCFRNPTKAQHHLETKPKCREAHEANVLQFRNDYPHSPNASVAPSLRFKAQLENMIDELLYTVRKLEHDHKVAAPDAFDYARFEQWFDHWQIGDLKEATFQQSWPPFVKDTPQTPPPEPEESHTTPLDLPEDDLLPLVEEKRMTKMEVMQKLLDDPSVDEASKAAMRKDLGIAPAPVSAPAPPPPVVAPYDIKMTPWQRVVSANPGLSTGELIGVAQGMGIRPDQTAGMKIVLNTKTRR